MTHSKILLLATALVLGAASFQPAMAENGRNGAAAAGIIGGLAAGAIIGGAIGNGEDRGDRGRRHGAIYRDQEDEPVCHIERRRVENEDGEVRVRRVRVCE